MSQPRSITGIISISESSLTEYLKSPLPDRDDFTDWSDLGGWSTPEWLESVKEGEGKSWKNTQAVFYWADCIEEWLTVSPEDVLITSYDAKNKELFFYHILRFDWWVKVRDDLTALRHLEKYVDPKRTSMILFLDDLFVSSPHLASSSIATVLDISKNKSQFSKKEIVSGEYAELLNEKISLYGEKAYTLGAEQFIQNKDFCYPAVYKAYQESFLSIKNNPNYDKIKQATPENPYWYNKGYYTDGNSVFTRFLGKIDGADPFSFTPIKEEFSKDNKHAYWYTNVIKESDGPTFKLLKDGLAEDRNHVYSGNMEVMKGVDPHSFKKVGVVIVSKSSAYYDQTVIAVDDATFSYLDGVYYSDKNYIYALFSDGLKIISNDINNFKILQSKDNSNYTYAKDNSFVFYNGIKLEGADAKTFRLEKRWGVDSAHVWFDGNLILGADAQTAQFNYPYYFFTDRNNAYYCASILPDADVATFKVIGDSAYAQDKDHIYFMADVIKDVDRNSFKVKSWNEAEDVHGRIYSGYRMDEKE